MTHATLCTICCLLYTGCHFVCYLTHSTHRLPFVCNLTHSISRLPFWMLRNAVLTTDVILHTISHILWTGCHFECQLTLSINRLFFFNTIPGVLHIGCHFVTCLKHSIWRQPFWKLFDTFYTAVPFCTLSPAFYRAFAILHDISSILYTDGPFERQLMLSTRRLSFTSLFVTFYRPAAIWYAISRILWSGCLSVRHSTDCVDRLPSCTLPDAFYIAAVILYDISHILHSGCHVVRYFTHSIYRSCHVVFTTPTLHTK